jgi:predicted transcriptional regulator YdeE
MIIKGEMVIHGLRGDGTNMGAVWEKFEKRYVKKPFDKVVEDAYEIRTYDRKKPVRPGVDVFIGYERNLDNADGGYHIMVLPAGEYAVFDVLAANGYDSENAAMEQWLDDNKERYIQRGDFIVEIKAADFNSSNDIKRLYEKASEIETRLIKADYKGNTADVNKIVSAAEKLIKHQFVWVLYLPPCKMLSSGFLRCDEQMMKFDKFWTQIDSKRHDRFYARDFMYWEQLENANVWWLALEDWMTDTLDMGSYEVIGFEGSLYAAAVCNNNEEPDFVRAYNGISEWIVDNDNVEIDERLRHRVMNNVILTDLRAVIFKD